METATAVASRDDALRRTIQEFPRALPQVRRTLAAVSGLSRKATPVSDDLGTAAVALTPVLRDLPATAADARKLVARLPAALRATDPFLKELKPAAQKAAPVADTLGPLLRDIARQPAHVLAVSGDLTQRARRGQFAAARAYLERIELPQVVVPVVVIVLFWMLHVLPDGKVQVIGGDPAGTMEIFSYHLIRAPVFGVAARLLRTTERIVNYKVSKYEIDCTRFRG